MGWHYKSPGSFPASYHSTFRQVANNLSKPYMLGGFLKLSDAKLLAERIRWFKWCIRQEPTVNSEMFTLISNYDVRTYTENDDFGCYLWLVAKPTKISDFVENNPKLASEILSTV